MSGISTAEVVLGLGSRNLAVMDSINNTIQSTLAQGMQAKKMAADIYSSMAGTVLAEEKLRQDEEFNIKSLGIQAKGLDLRGRDLDLQAQRLELDLTKEETDFEFRKRQLTLDEARAGAQIEYYKTQSERAQDGSEKHKTYISSLQRQAARTTSDAAMQLDVMDSQIKELSLRINGDGKGVEAND